MAGQFSPCLGLDFRDEKTEDTVEKIDLLVAVTARATDKQRGDTLQHFGALLARAVCDDVFELGDERSGGSHRRSPLNSSPVFEKSWHRSKIYRKHRSGAGRKYVGGERRKFAYLIPPLRKD